MAYPVKPIQHSEQTARLGRRIVALFSFAATAVLIWSIGWSGMRAITGTRPTDHSTATAIQVNRTLHAATSRADTDLPDDPVKLREAARKLSIGRHNPDTAAVDDLLQTIAALSKLVALNPRDSDSLLSLADLCFSFGVLDKAAHYYNRYLELKPEDRAARARYTGIVNAGSDTAGAVAQLNRLLTTDELQN